jgi:hypothetical protein
MASAVADLEAGLQAMLNLKPPGVSGSRITSLTSLCVANIQVGSLHHLSITQRMHQDAYTRMRARLRKYRPVADSTFFSLVRIGSHPEDLHPLQKGSWDAQAGRPLRRRLCNTEVA